MLQNPFGKQAEHIGAKTCAVLFSVLGEALTVNSKYSASTLWYQKQADKHAIQSTVGQAEGQSTDAGVIYAVARSMADVKA